MGEIDDLDEISIQPKTEHKSRKDFLRKRKFAMMQKESMLKTPKWKKQLRIIQSMKKKK